MRDVENVERVRQRPPLARQPEARHQELQLAGPVAENFESGRFHDLDGSLDNLDKASVTGEELQTVVSRVGDDDVPVREAGHATRVEQAARFDAETPDGLDASAGVHVPDREAAILWQTKKRKMERTIEAIKLSKIHNMKLAASLSV